MLRKFISKHNKSNQLGLVYSSRTNKLSSSFFLATILLLLALKTCASFHYFSHELINLSPHLLIDTALETTAPESKLLATGKWQEKEAKYYSLAEASLHSHCDICDFFGQISYYSFLLNNLELKNLIALLILLPLAYWHKITKNNYFSTAPPICLIS
jgi:hypothetical protein